MRKFIAISSIFTAICGGQAFALESAPLDLDEQWSAAESGAGFRKSPFQAVEDLYGKGCGPIVFLHPSYADALPHPVDVSCESRVRIQDETRLAGTEVLAITCEPEEVTEPIRQALSAALWTKQANSGASCGYLGKEIDIPVSDHLE